MELLDFQESTVSKNKFYKLHETLEKIKGMTKDKDGALSSKNEIIKVWNSSQIISSQ